MLSDIILGVFMMRVIMLSVVTLSFVMLSVSKGMVENVH
jgi:hypothetical protein